MISWMEIHIDLLTAATDTQRERECEAIINKIWKCLRALVVVFVGMTKIRGIFMIVCVMFMRYWIENNQLTQSHWHSNKCQAMTYDSTKKKPLRWNASSGIFLCFILIVMSNRKMAHQCPCPWFEISCFVSSSLHAWYARHNVTAFRDCLC